MLIKKILSSTSIVPKTNIRKITQREDETVAQLALRVFICIREEHMYQNAMQIEIDEDICIRPREFVPENVPHKICELSGKFLYHGR